MPIGVSQFQILSPDQANGFQYGLNKAVEARLNAANARYNTAQAQKQERLNPNVAREQLSNILHQELVNKYYGRNIESEIGLRGAQSSHLGTETDLNRQKLEYPGLGQSGLVGETAWLSQMADHPEMAQKINAYMQQQAEANNEKYQPYNPISMGIQNINADIAEKQAKAKYWGMGGSKGSVKEKNLNSFINSVAMEHPDWDQSQVGMAADAYLAGEKGLPTGEPLPALGGRAQQALENVQSGNAPAALKTQYANLDTLATNLNDFDIEALATFTGPAGALRLQEEKAKMAANSPDVDPVARRYFTAVNQSIVTMDEMRKAFGTSVVPDYVYQTVGKLANPNDSIWLDPKQVKANFDATRDIMNKNRDILKYKIQHGVTAELPKSLKYSSNPVEGKKEMEKVSEPSAGAKQLAKKLVLPKFDSAQEFNGWLARQPKITKDAVLLKLGKK